MPPPSDIRTLIWEETLAADMRQRYFQALAASASSFSLFLRIAIPLTTVMTFLSAAGVVLQQLTIPLSVVAFAAGLVVAIANPGARVVAMVGLSVAWGEIHEQYKRLWIELQQRESATDDLYRRARELDERGTALSRQSTPYRHRPRLLNKCLDQVVAGC